MLGLPTRPREATGQSATSLPVQRDDGAATTSALPSSEIAPVPVVEGNESFISGMIKDNPYFSAGAGLMGLGVALTVMRRGVNFGATWAQRRMLVTLEIPSKDRSYGWFLEWMSAQSIAATEASGASAASTAAGGGTKGKAAAGGPLTGIRALLRGSTPMQLRSHELSVETTVKQHENGSSEALFNLVPGPGTHYFRYRGSWFQVKRERDAKLMDLHSGTPWETLTLTTLSSSRDLFPLLLDEARELAEQSTEGKTVVYTAWGVEWRPLGKPRRRREMGSVVLGKDVARRIELDLAAFLGRGKWYADRGIPYRRGYLLHGPPGSGKTSFIQALAGSFNYNICLLNLAERGLTDDKLNHLLGIVPERSFILLEDVDSAFNRRVQSSEDGYKSSVTFSGLLNALDGVASSEERIVFMTTNHFDRLDPALIRPGRVDLRELIDDAAGEQARRLFTRFYAPQGLGSTVSLPGGSRSSVEEGVTKPIAGSGSARGGGGDNGVGMAKEEDIEAMGDELARIVDDARGKGWRLSMASLQGHFIRHDDVRESLDTIEELYDGQRRREEVEAEVVVEQEGGESGSRP